MADKVPLKFSRTAPTQLQFKRILKAQPSGITQELADAALETVQEEERKMRFGNPKLSFVDRFMRLAEICGPALLIVMRASTDTLHEGKLASAEDVADEYTMEET